MNDVATVVYSVLDIIDMIWSRLDNIVLFANMTLLSIIFATGYLYLLAEAAMHIIGKGEE